MIKRERYRKAVEHRPDLAASIPPPLGGMGGGIDYDKHPDYDRWVETWGQRVADEENDAWLSRERLVGEPPCPTSR